MYVMAWSLHFPYKFIENHQKTGTAISVPKGRDVYHIGMVSPVLH